MGKVNQLWQDERDARWQQHYDEYIESFDGRAGICLPEAAAQYANDMMEEEDYDNGQFGVGA